MKLKVIKKLRKPILEESTSDFGHRSVHKKKNRESINWRQPGNTTINTKTDTTAIL